jgi:hypothetical protein
MFNPNDHLMNLKGKAYLEVKWRLVWFRQEHPDWSIRTQIVDLNLEQKYAVFKAIISNENGVIVAEGTKMEDARGFADFMEKAETGSIGRALGILGYGTQFAPEFDEVDSNSPNPRIVDAPISQPKPKVQDSSAPTPSKVFGDLAREYLGANHSTKERAELYEKIVGSKDVSPNGWQTAIVGLEAMLIDRKEAVDAK